MKTKTALFLQPSGVATGVLVLLATLNPPLSTALAQVPQLLHYQGRAITGGTNFEGTGQFKFALVSSAVNLSRQATAQALTSGGSVASVIVLDGGAGYTTAPSVSFSGGGGATAVAVVSGGIVVAINVINGGAAYPTPPTVTIGAPPANLVTSTYWSNDGSSTDGAEPTAALSLSVTKGLYAVLLGDTSLPNMSAVPASVFANPDVRLRVWFNDGTHGFQQMTPDQRIAAVGYAMMAGSVTDGSITSAKLAAGAVSSAHIASGAVGSTQLASGSVGSAQLADGAVDATKLATVTNWFPKPIYNPDPDSGFIFGIQGDEFGACIAGVGADRILIGAPQEDPSSRGSAYLFSTNGGLLRTFTSPNPRDYEEFGSAVAVATSDFVLVGAPGFQTSSTISGTACLFDINGTTLTTFTNPAAAAGDNFGQALSFAGTDRVVIGAPGVAAGFPGAGAAYLFNTNGTLLASFANPTPAADDNFGQSVSFLGNDRVLVGTPGDDTGLPNAGAAYLFSTNGDLLVAFTNPSPAIRLFGAALTSAGEDRVFIGAPGDPPGGSAGAAHFFSANGTLLATFVNPNSTNTDNFGQSVATFGSQRLLVGAGRAAYEFDLAGTLVRTFPNPKSSSLADLGVPIFGFGVSVAYFGGDNVVVGAKGATISGSSAGEAYMYFPTSFSKGLVADSVRPYSIGTIDLQDGAVTETKLANGVIARALEAEGLGSWSSSPQLGAPPILHTGGSVGIGTPSPQFLLHVAGEAGKPGGGTWSAASDERLKQNVQPLIGALDKLLALRGVTFEYKEPEKIHELPGERIGMIAQEVERVFPDWVHTGPDGYKRVTVRGLEALTVEALRELQQQQNQRLADELKRRDAENAELRRRLESVEQLLDRRTNGAKK